MCFLEIYNIDKDALPSYDEVRAAFTIVTLISTLHPGTSTSE